MQVRRCAASLNGSFRRLARSYASTRFFEKHLCGLGPGRIEEPLCRDFLSDLIGHADHKVHRTKLPLDVLGDLVELPLPGFGKRYCLLQMGLRLVPGFEHGHQPLFLPPPKVIEVKHAQSKCSRLPLRRMREESTSRL